MINPLDYYKRAFIKKEITDFSRGRWVALHCEVLDAQNKPIMIRYLNNKPLQIDSLDDIDALLNKFKKFNPRTFYASANIYHELSYKYSAFNYIHNVVARTPTWDIDSSISVWRLTLEAAQEVVRFLEKEDVTKSVYLIWSGNGIHVHIHERAFSKELYEKIHPLDVGYSVVEYVLQNIQPSLLKLNKKAQRLGSTIKIENLMDPQRVFTAPLSLHRRLDVATVSFKPDDIDNFDISWTSPTNPKNNPNWRQFVNGEADALAEKAFSLIGSYKLKFKSKRRTKYSTKDITQLILDAVKKAYAMRKNKEEDGRSLNQKG